MHFRFIFFLLLLFNLLKQYKVKLKFSGHYHYNLGHNKGFYESGSTARGTYLKLDIDTQYKKAKIYESKGVNTTDLRLIADLYLDTSMGEVEPPSSLPRVAKVKNKGGYVSKVYVDYTDVSGDKVSKKSPKLSLGNTYSVDIPAGSTDLKVRSESNTGLVWEPTRVIFDEYIDESKSFCAETWNTALKPKWGHVSCN